MAIKLFHAGQPGAPQLSGSNGALITVLDAVLVNGYNQVTVSSITFSSGVATVTCGGNHGLQSGDVALLAGADQAEYNGEFVISNPTATSFTMLVTGTPISPATGSITCKRAPGGFEKAFSAANKGAYRSLDTTLSCRPYLQVLDFGATTGGAKEAQVRGYLTMTDVDNGTEPFPDATQYASGLFAYKSNAISAAARPWVLLTDGRVFYFQACMDQAPSTMQASGGYLWWLAFGDIVPNRPNDPYCGFLAATQVTNIQTTGTAAAGRNGLFVAFARSYAPTNVSAFFLPRSHTQSAGAVPGCPVGHGWDELAMGALALFPYPNPPDNGLYLTPVCVASGGVFRGRMPGVYEPLQGRVLNQFDLVTNVEGYPGRTFIALWGVNAQSTVTTGMLLFDLTGDSFGRWS